MAYKVRLGHANMSGSLGTDDIIYSEDDDTLIDFSSDRIKFKTDNTSRLEIGNNRIQIKDQLVVGSVDVGTWALTVPTEDVLHVQDGNVMLQTNSADADASELLFNKSRNATDGSVTVVQDDDKLGGITFGGADGSNYDPAASISAHVDGTPGSNDMPGRLVFSTTADGSNSTTERMRIDSSGKVGIGTNNPNFELHVAGEIGVDQYIRHNGDPNTHINFADDKIVLKAGNKAMVTMEEKGSAPHEVTINDGSNNIDFVVKGNGSGQGNPGMKFDADTNRLGINGVGTPDKALHVGGSMKLDGSQSTICFADGDTEKAEIGINSSDNILIENKTINKHIVFKCNDQGVVREGLRLDGAVPEVVVNQQSESLVDFRVESNNQTHMLFVDGSADKVGIKTNQPETALDINADAIRLRNSSTPSSASDYGFPGEIRWDANYIYVCVATDTWKRVALSSW